MGEILSHTYFNGVKPSTIPDSNSKPTFEPGFGFKGPRKERVSKISVQEMKALRIPKDKRDYCAHFLKDFLVCRKHYTPAFGLCYPELHAYHHCEREDYNLRMKEYEREKRLRMREEKIKAKAA